MKVKLIVPMGAHNAGDVVNVSQKHGEGLILLGMAEQAAVMPKPKAKTKEKEKEK